MRVLIGCEWSGRVRESFRALGHDAMSCDWDYDTEILGPHYKGNVLDVLYDGWDLFIAHPDCTYLTNSGVQWLTRTPNNPSPGVLYGRKRVAAMKEAAAFMRLLLDAPIKKIAVENPIPHGRAATLIGKPYTQIIQPYHFGEPESKATCLWLKGLPPLVATNIIPKEERKQSTFLMAPGKDRAHLRGRTFWGIARAMASQWGNE